MSNILSGICKVAGTVAGAYFGGAAGAAVGYKGGELLGGLFSGDSNTETASNTKSLNKALTIGKDVKEVASNKDSNSKDIISTLANGLLGSDEKETINLLG